MKPGITDLRVLGMWAGMQRFSLRRAVNIQKPLYVVPPSSEAAAIRAEFGGGPALTAPGREHNMNVSIRNVLWRRRTEGLESENGEQGPGCRAASNDVFFYQDWDICSDIIYFEKIHLPPKMIS